MPALAADKIKLASVADYGKCIERSEADADTCTEALDAYVKNHPGEAFAAGKAVRAKLTHAAAIPFFAKAFAKAGDTKRCADEDVTMALVSAFSMPASYKHLIDPARTILFDRCWEQTHEGVLSELTKAGADSSFAENICPTLAAKKQASAACEKKPQAPVAAVPPPKWNELDPKAIAVEEPAKVFKGQEGKALTLVKVKGSPDAYLVKFDGFRGPWNGKVVLHREQPASSGFDYFTQASGSRWVSVVARGEGSLFYEVYPTGDKGPFPVSYDESASKSTKAKSILDQFVNQPRK